MDYSFNVQVANTYGVDGAIMLQNLYWWIAKNEANGRHYYEGKSWTYNTIKAFAELFPFWTEKQLRRILENLKNNGAIYVGNFNTKPFDRTQWYALSEDVLKFYNVENTICPNGKKELTKQSNGIDQTGKPIPDNKPYSKPNINTKKESIEEKTDATKSEKVVKSYDSTIKVYTDNKELQTALIEFIKMRKLLKKPMTDKALELMLSKLNNLADTDTEKINVINQSICSSWQGIFPLKEIGSYGRTQSPPTKPSVQPSKYQRSE